MIRARTVSFGAVPGGVHERKQFSLHMIYTSGEPLINTVYEMAQVG